ncbi:MAG: helix-turn-helix domain-containing protein [Chitinophagales bacterium]
MLNERNIRLIFGLKLRQLRQKKQMQPKALAKAAGISPSYLNEIEKGKKYPQPQKIVSLANVLEVSYDEMVSLKLDKQLSPIVDLLQSNALQDLPLDTFGIGTDKLVELISNAPAKVSAFISTLIDIARNYEMKVEQFYLTALRSYQQMHDNYFEEIEESVQLFMSEHQENLKADFDFSLENLQAVLTKKYRYTIDEKRLSEYPELRSVRSLFVKKKRKNLLLINDNLNAIQQKFQLGKEIGYQYMKLPERNIGPSWMQKSSFEQVLNNFKASYFAGALLINRKPLIADLSCLFQNTTWNGEAFLQMMKGYQVSPETFMHRITSVLPRFFGLNQLFFLRFTNTQKDDQYVITKELHLPKPHNPHGNQLNEHYCRRWITINILKELAEAQTTNKKAGPIVRVQRSLYIDSGNEYFCISIARAMYPTPNRNSSVTIGFLMNKDFKNKVKFWNDPNIAVRMVNETCQRCRLTDCKERAVEATVLQQQAKIESAEAAVENLLNSF